MATGRKPGLMVPCWSRALTSCQMVTKFRRRQLLCLFCLLVIGAIFNVFSMRPHYMRVSHSMKGFLEKLLPVNAWYRRVPQCRFFDANSTALKGPIDADTDSIPSFAELEFSLAPTLQPGGIFVPHYCRPPHKVAIIVPFRERKVHLKMFLRHMHPFLQRQDLHYGIFVVEQADQGPFNRALLMNVGYVEALRLNPKFDCFVFHDVDLLPLDDRIYYSCKNQPVHLSANIDVHGNRLMYQNLFGGASMLTKEMMEKVNGFSNLYFGWGGEDDDMSFRVRSHDMKIARYTLDIARYTMIRHAKEDKNDSRRKLLKEGRTRIHQDGLNSLQYERVQLDLRPLFTLIQVKVNQSQILAKQELLQGDLKKLRKT
ncbi:beta-1,4-galactosyltransferase [Elysia marginata]|uniref:Beta-1,4-galactosyltransferase n=1 Tax=Elysia marginata TaxID=1093978 RepID=A0AAV4IEJ5_9GAST|nr:beta-1,4-galactosyltransferase [Elysia marginata]